MNYINEMMGEKIGRVRVGVKPRIIPDTFAGR